MKRYITFGKFSRFYWLIIASTLIKVLINIFLKLEYSDRVKRMIVNSSLLEQPELNSHIFIYFIYYYFGFILFSLIFLYISNSKEKNKINFNKKLLSEESAIINSNINSNLNSDSNNNINDINGINKSKNMSSDFSNLKKDDKKYVNKKFIINFFFLYAFRSFNILF